ncbi:hypothetical protein EDD16DRAFT_1520546 [Pisolithus croceorrhizus]|nr:hypothetical protein EDD16DRAFT_1520546 [Pisolithus croceorrhizus]
MVCQWSFHCFSLLIVMLSTTSSPGTLDIDCLSAKLFASSLCDNGPDLDSQPSKLWASCEEFQVAASMNIGDVGIPDISDLVDAVGQISIADRSTLLSLFHTNSYSTIPPSVRRYTPRGYSPVRHPQAEYPRLIEFLVLSKPRFHLLNNISLNQSHVQHGGEEQLGQDVTTNTDLNVEAVRYDSLA